MALAVAILTDDDPINSTTLIFYANKENDVTNSRLGSRIAFYLIQANAAAFVRINNAN